ncbi:hypothetical protein WJX73_006771 [Symbiochloris irregularis]|uniref:pyridoxal 5'-phosphate synthase n=1 Tax=Symbiochloris irregularis TaxID=706552 RepID=A0AAW1P3V2_9CHLO
MLISRASSVLRRNSHVLVARASNARSATVMSAAWRKSLDTSLTEQAKNPIAKFFQLATVRGSGKPANRTMVFRGFLGDTEQVMFVTDHRTEKLEEIKNKDWAEICWYFPDSREQFRIGGSMAVVGGDSQDQELLKVREQAWDEQGANSKKWYTQPKPGAPRDKDDSKFEKDPPDSVHPEFVLVSCIPDHHLWGVP